MWVRFMVDYNKGMKTKPERKTEKVARRITNKAHKRYKRTPITRKATKHDGRDK